MAVRFRKSVKVAPGIRLNIGLRGLGLSVGPRGSSVSFGQRGTHANIGLPGTGLSFRQRLDQSATPRKASRPQALVGTANTSEKSQIEITFNDDGSISYTDQGVDLPPELVRVVRQQNKSQIEAGLQAACDKFNTVLAGISSLHLATPAPQTERAYTALPFADRKPKLQLKNYTGLQRLLPFLRGSTDRENAGIQARHEQHTAEWQQRKAEHDQAQAELVRHHLLVNSDRAAIEHELEHVLTAIDWPRETLLNYQLSNDSSRLDIDIDLPEIEDFPTEEASVAARFDRLIIKRLSDTKVRQHYALYIHAALFRLAGEVFASLPTVQTVLASGYSQRTSKQTGNVQDEFLISCTITRAAWADINFDNLAHIDPIAALESFTLTREMNRQFNFKPITPQA